MMRTTEMKLSQFKILTEDYSKDELLEITLDEYSWDSEEEAKTHIKYILTNLNDIRNKSNIKLYRVLFLKKNEKVNKKKLGLHYVLDPEDFNEEMLDYLETSSSNIKGDNYLATIEINTNDIDYSGTQFTNAKHPFESEILLKTDKNIKLLKLEKY